MAIIADRADDRKQIDRPFRSANRKVTATPVGTLIPVYVNELIFDTTATKWWRATDATTSGWVTVVGPEY